MEIYPLNLWTHMDETRTKWNHILPLCDAAAFLRVNRPGGGDLCFDDYITKDPPPGSGIGPCDLFVDWLEQESPLPKLTLPPRPCRMLMKCAKIWYLQAQKYAQ